MAVQPAQLETSEHGRGVELPELTWGSQRPLLLG
jgi:hypothetical protein